MNAPSREIKTGVVKTAHRVVVFLQDGTNVVISKPASDSYVVVLSFDNREDATTAVRAAAVAKRKRADKNYVLPGTQELPLDA
jgi:hypothetical protein